MKIEIEYREIEALKERIHQLEYTNKGMEAELLKLNEKQLIKQSIKLSEQLFRNYLSTIFKKLGFQSNIRDISFEEAKHYLGEKWWENPNLKVEFGATITNEWKRAFLNLGISSDNENLQDEDKIKLAK